MSGQADMWDQLDANTYWQSLPATTADEYFSGETASIFIKKENGLWWITTYEGSGADAYQTLEEAKAAGQRTIDQGYEQMNAEIIKDLGVDDLWGVDTGDGFIAVTSRLNEDVRIYGGEGARTWSAIAGPENSDDVEVLVNTNDFDEALRAAKAKLVELGSSLGL